MAREWNIRTSGELPPNVEIDKGLEEALNRVRTVPGAAEKFANDPEGYLKSVGIDTTQMQFTSGQAELSDADLEQVAGGTAERDGDVAAVCASGGYYICVTAG